MTLNDLLEKSPDLVVMCEPLFKKIVKEAVDKVLDPDCELQSFDISRTKRGATISFSYTGWNYFEIEVIFE